MLQHYDGFTYQALKEVSGFKIHNCVLICKNAKKYIPGTFVSIRHNMTVNDVFVNQVYFVTKLLAKSDKLEVT